MRKLLLFIAIICSLKSHAQLNMADKYILIDSAWGASMANMINADPAHHYNFGQPIKTIGKRWVTPAVNYIYFVFPDDVEVVRLPADSFITTPQPTSTVSH